MVRPNSHAASTCLAHTTSLLVNLTDLAKGHLPLPDSIRHSTSCSGVHPPLPILSRLKQVKFVNMHCPGVHVGKKAHLIIVYNEQGQVFFLSV
jgi:hypothetical protein